MTYISPVYVFLVNILQSDVNHHLSKLFTKNIFQALLILWVTPILGLVSKCTRELAVT